MINASQLGKLIQWDFINTSSKTKDNNPACQWGIDHEPQALEHLIPYLRRHYHLMTTYPVSYVKYQGFGCRPDGLFTDANNKWWLIEVKCPYSRPLIKARKNIPWSYWLQMQLELYIFRHLYPDRQIAGCIYAEYKFWADDCHRLDFWLCPVYYQPQLFQELIIPYVKDMTRGKRRGTRRGKRSVYQSILSAVRSVSDKRNIFHVNFYHNYIMEDPLLDYLNLYHPDSKQGYKTHTYITWNKKADTLHFKAHSYSVAQAMDFSDHCKAPHPGSLWFIYTSLKLTLQAICNQHPVIKHGISARLLGNHVQICTIDLLAQYRVVEKHLPSKHQEADPQQYVLITVLPRVPKSGSYKRFIYAREWLRYQTLQELGVCLAPVSWIYQSEVLDRPWHLVDIHQPGTHSYRQYNQWISRAHQWWITLRSPEAQQLTYDPPDRLELYPNMKNTYYHGPWKDYLTDLANKNKEMTLIWNINVSWRNRIIQHTGVTRWDQLTAQILTQVSIPTSRLATIHNIVVANRLQRITHLSQLKQALRATIHEYPTHFYVDFEFTPHLIFQIGCLSCRPGGQREYKSFMLTELTSEGQQKIISQWLSYMRHLQPEGQHLVIHWGHAEQSQLATRLDLLTCPVNAGSSIIGTLKLLNLAQWCRHYHLGVPGAFSYGLKEMAWAMYRAGYINSIWPDRTLSGYNLHHKLDALAGPDKDLVLQDMVDYNYLDCLVMQEMVAYWTRQSKLTETTQ